MCDRERVGESCSWISAQWLINWQNSLITVVNKPIIDPKRISSRLCVKTRPRTNHSYVLHPDSFSCKLNLFSYEGFWTKSRFEAEALGNSKMGY